MNVYDIITFIRRNILGYDGLTSKVDNTVFQMIVESEKTKNKIKMLNSVIIRTKTYYLGKAMGVIRE